MRYLFDPTGGLERFHWNVEGRGGARATNGFFSGLAKRKGAGLLCSDWFFGFHLIIAVLGVGQTCGRCRFELLGGFFRKINDFRDFSRSLPVLLTVRPKNESRS